MIAPIPANEQERLAALAAYHLLDTEPEQTFQDLMQLAAHVFQVPMALVVLVDRDRQWFKAKIGIEAKQTSRDVAFCSYTILGTELLLVPDAHDDARFATNPLVTASPFIRFYAGAPLITPDGYALGTFCLLDHVPRTLTSEQRSSLRIMADHVMERIELRRRVREAEQMAEERLQAETRLRDLMSHLRENEERTQLLLDTAMDAVIAIDTRSIITAWYRQAEVMFGWKREEAIGVPLDELIMPQAFRNAHRRGMQQFLLTGDGPILNQYIEVAALHRDGHQFPVEIAVVPLKTPEGIIFNAFVRDITQRQQADEALRKSQTKLAKAQRLAHIGSWEYNRQSQEVLWSEEVYRIFELDMAQGPLTYEELLRRHHPDDWAVLEAAIQNAYVHQQPFNLELRIFSPIDGSLRYIQTHGGPLVDEYGQVTSLVGMMIDITERKRTEEVLARQAAELGLALEKSEQASRLKSEFVAGVSHELRTPLNGVIGMTDLLLNTELTTTQRELAQTAHTSAESLLGLIDDVLDFSRIEAGKLTLEPVPFDLQTVVEEVAEMLAANAEARALKFIVEYTLGTPRHLIGDAGRIRQILVNLVGNAVKFTPKGHILVRVACLHLTAERAQIQVSVEDTGIGIAPDNLDRIFEQFTQADSSTTRQYGGTGLGLTISRQLAHLMEGNLEASSVPGEGSSFALTINLLIDRNALARGNPNVSGLFMQIGTEREVEPQRLSGAQRTVQAHPGLASHLAPAPASEIRTPQPLPSPGIVLRILVVEDNAVNQRVVQLMLQKSGYQADPVTNGLEALSMLERAPYDLILMDCQMPEMDGYETTRRIRNLEQGQRHTPIIALTANTMQGDREKCLSAGMDDFLSKPMRLHELLNVLQRYLPMAGSPTAVVRNYDIEPPFPLSALTNRIGKDIAQLRAFAALLQDNAARLLTECRQSAKAGDSAALSVAAHALKGLLMNLEARHAIDLARLLERFGQEAELPDAMPLLASLEAEIARVTAHLVASIAAVPE